MIPKSSRISRVGASVSGRKRFRSKKRLLDERRVGFDANDSYGRVATYKRYSHVDRFLIRALKLGRGSTVKFLDVGCCPNIDGAPTTERTFRVFRKLGINIKMTAVDKNFPDGFRKQNKGIDYVKTDIIDAKIKEKFDIVRATELLQYIDSPVDRAYVVNNIFRSIKEGGFLVINADSPTGSNFGHMIPRGLSPGILILKKVGGKMVLFKHIQKRADYLIASKVDKLRRALMN